MDTDFTVDNGAHLVLMHKLDRVLNGDDVLAHIGIDVVDHCRKGGGLT